MHPEIEGQRCTYIPEILENPMISVEASSLMPDARCFFQLQLERRIMEENLAMHGWKLHP